MSDEFDVDATKPNSPRTSERAPKKLAAKWAKLAIFIGVVAIVAGLIVGFRDRLSLAVLAERESQLVEFGTSHPVLIIAASFLIYVFVTALSIPAATVLTLTIAWVMRRMFGPVQGFVGAVVLVNVASSLGATLAFLLSRYLFRDAVQARFGQYLDRFNAAWERDGLFYLFTLRLIPHVPFFIVNVVMGLTKIRALTFWWVSQLGMLPGTILFVYAGWAVPSLTELAPQLEARGIRAILSVPLIIAFALLGLFPLVVKKLFDRIARSRSRNNA